MKLAGEQRVNLSPALNMSAADLPFCGKTRLSCSAIRKALALLGNLAGFISYSELMLLMLFLLHCEQRLFFFYFTASLLSMGLEESCLKKLSISCNQECNFLITLSWP